MRELCLAAHLHEALGLADAVGSEFGGPAMAEIVGADQQHHCLRRRPVEIAVPGTALVAAVRIGKTRLIDNVLVP